MGLGHGHAHGANAHVSTAADGVAVVAQTAGARHRSRLLIAFLLVLAFTILELVVGIVVGSLALISDAAHMGTDVLGLGMALAAITLAARPGREHSGKRTYGLFRLEVLAALANGLLLFALSGYVIVEAIIRFTSPNDVPGLPLLVVASIGLVISVVNFRLLNPGAKESINLRAAYIEVTADMLGALGVIVAAIIILATGWPYADPLVGLAIGLFILPRTWKLTGQAVRILLEAAPPTVDVDRVRAEMLAINGVVDVHDLHIWTITSGMESATGHVVVAEGADYHSVLDDVVRVLNDDFHITHTTIQCEPEVHDETARTICGPVTPTKREVD